MARRVALAWGAAIKLQGAQITNERTQLSPTTHVRMSSHHFSTYQPPAPLQCQQQHSSAGRTRKLLPGPHPPPRSSSSPARPCASRQPTAGQAEGTRGTCVPSLRSVSCRYGVDAGVDARGTYFHMCTVSSKRLMLDLFPSDNRSNAKRVYRFLLLVFSERSYLRHIANIHGTT